MNRGTVLVIEDDDDWRSLLFGYLVDSYDVMAVGDYSSAVDIIQARSFDVIVLDLRLEDQDDENFQGMELLSLLREKEREENWSTNIIITSAYGTHQQVREGFKIHALFDYVPKHKFDKREYQDIVRRAVCQRWQKGS